jgi:hypothetical protein
MIKKLKVMMMNRVGMRPRNLRMMYFVIDVKKKGGERALIAGALSPRSNDYLFGAIAFVG